MQNLSASGGLDILSTWGDKEFNNNKIEMKLKTIFLDVINQLSTDLLFIGFETFKTASADKPTLIKFKIKAVISLTKPSLNSADFAIQNNLRMTVNGGLLIRETQLNGFSLAVYSYAVRECKFSYKLNATDMPHDY